MVSAKERDIIINAIRVLRSRRVRPSQRKISWYVRREHLLPESTTDAVLDQLVESEEVLRVSYKGGTSYRVAANWSKAALVRRRPTRTKVNVMNSESTCRVLKDAVLAACGTQGGATKYSIGAQLRAIGQERLLSKLDVLLHREVRAGSLLRVVTTHKNDEVVTYILPPTAAAAAVAATVAPDTPAPSPPDVAAALGKWRCTTGNHPGMDVGDQLEEVSSQLNDLQGSTQQQPGVGQNDAAVTVQSSVPSHGRQLGGPHPGPHPPAAGNVALSAYERMFVASMSSSPTTAATATSGGDKTRPRGRPPGSGTSKSNQQPDNMRSPSKRSKRAKKVFDPSEMEDMLLHGQMIHVPVTSVVHNGQTIPVTFTTSTSDILPQRKAKPDPNRCDVCTNTVNTLNMHEDLLLCHNCQAKAHPSCLGYSAELAIRSRLAPWTCMDCKHCAICNMDHNIGTLIFCDECDEAYHLTCHQPPLSQQPQGSWICFNCIPKQKQNGYECVPGLPTPRDSPVPEEESRGSTGGPWDTQVIDEEVPNATHWPVEQVVQYFNEKGFQENSDVFRQQDIDGTSLLMLTRNDVLCGLQLKLGPALKMYKHVRILQTRLLNPPLP